MSNFLGSKATQARTVEPLTRGGVERGHVWRKTPTPAKTAIFWHYSLIAGTSGDKRRKLTAFSCSYSATGGTRTRTRMAAPIEYEYEYRFTEYEYEFDAINTGDQREESIFSGKKTLPHEDYC